MFTDPSPPSPFPPPPSPPFADSSVNSAAAVSSGDSDGHSGGPSVLIIISIIALIIAASASLHLLLRLISRSRSSSSSSSSTSSSSPTSPAPLLRSIPIDGNSTEALPASSDREKLITSLPLFSLASSVADFRKSSSLDCAVCLSNFRPQDELRLLPACRHAFHSQCVDTWLRSTPSCPLCRASIYLPPLPPASSPPTETVSSLDSSRSGSFRVEIGTVSRRRASADGNATPHGRSYSLGSSFEYLVDEEVEAVLESLRSAPEGKADNGGGGAPPVPLPEPEIFDAASGGGRGWLRDCVDRLTSSASSSFNSLRFSGRNGSHRFDPALTVAATGGSRRWDMEANNFMEWEEESGFASFYRWLVGI
ncbi:E3 ubiquitin-protein ligase ATL4 [Platanthera guangdongensis]|uniref:E3 ubiquitin-protein ligase ATL4 n=1 Tax=Platanthera guangdongensis TaxID=2320717 RepID=A0ABR2LNZ1_9ASPA